jgi:transcriptional regulator with XRE-family HTH domain
MPTANHVASLSRKVRALRELQGISQHDLARQAGVSRGVVARLELGRLGGGVAIDTVVSLARALGVTSSELLGETTPRRRRRAA